MLLLDSRYINTSNPDTQELCFMRYRIRDPAEVQDIRMAHHVVYLGGKIKIGCWIFRQKLAYAKVVFPL